MQMFQEVPLFHATYNIKTERQTINSTYPVSVRCGRLAEGKGHETLHDTNSYSMVVGSRGQPNAAPPDVRMKSVLVVVGSVARTSCALACAGENNNN